MSHGHLYWDWNPQTWTWDPNPENNPQGTHGTQPTDPPHGANPDNQPWQMPTGNEAWKSMGLLGNEAGTAWWMSSLLDNLRDNPANYGIAPENLTQDFFQGLIDIWMGLDAGMQTNIMTNLSPVDPDIINQASNLINDPGTPDVPLSPPGGGGGGGGAPGDGVVRPGGEQTWQGGNTEEAYRAARAAWEASGRVGPPPIARDFGATLVGGVMGWHTSGGDGSPGADGGPQIQGPPVQDGGHIAGGQGGLKGGVGATITGPPDVAGGGTPGLEPPMPEPDGKNWTDYGQGALSATNPAPSASPGVNPQGQQSTYGSEQKPKKFKKKYPPVGSGNLGLGGG